MCQYCALKEAAPAIIAVVPFISVAMHRAISVIIRRCKHE